MAKAKKIETRGRPRNPNKVEIKRVKKRDTVMGNPRSNMLTMRLREPEYKLIKLVAKHKNISMASFSAKAMLGASIRYAKVHNLAGDFIADVDSKG